MSNYRYALPVRQGSLVLRLLTGPTLHRIEDRERAVRSRLTYREDTSSTPVSYRLTPLGVLNGLFGLAVRITD